ncbi:unnamed protein product [Paramecium sonneborni]|uniref:Transmembrane protein n=1 Tax=Paramecium sonneborni TaxID=65129 RepID=A0A8S1R6K4_9CILI|nr:unnamed protein product [Paramecium sonneborni]
MNFRSKVLYIKILKALMLTKQQILVVQCVKEGFIFDFIIGEYFRRQQKILIFVVQDHLSIYMVLKFVLYLHKQILALHLKQQIVRSIILIVYNVYLLQNQDFNVQSVIRICEFNNLRKLLLIYVTQGNDFEEDGYVQLIQNFMMQFLPDQYYQQFTADYLKKIEIKLQKYCSNQCLNCKVDYFSFLCLKCPLYYYKQHIRVELEGQCVTCSNLCQYCQVRNEEEISALQSNFLLQMHNLQLNFLNQLMILNQSSILILPMLNIVLTKIVTQIFLFLVFLIM